MTQDIQLVLASTSPYRKVLLEKLTSDFSTLSPNIDESPIAQETPKQLVERLSLEKAKACVSQLTEKNDYVIIGSDQVCIIDGQIVGKPYTTEKAIEQLSKQSGKSITFMTGLALMHSDGTHRVTTDTVEVHFRQLTQAQIRNYVEREQPLYCAGSFKSEGLGIALFDKIDAEDPNTLVGLPLIKLTKLLLEFDIDLLS